MGGSSYFGVLDGPDCKTKSPNPRSLQPAQASNGCKLVHMETDVRTEFIGADSLLYAVSHRPWPPPDAPWVMTQTWNDLAFLHYAIEPRVIRALVPDVLTLDIYSGNAFVSVTPFWMNHVRPPGMPSVPGFSSFGELNVRTYVSYEGKPGVFFFSLDVSNLSAVWAARVFYRLPYWHAEIKVGGQKATASALRREASGFPEITYGLKRIHGPKAGDGMPEFRARYRPVAAAIEARPRSLHAFLAERYCLYAYNRQKLYRAEIHHLPWPLQQAEVEVEKNTMAVPVGLELPPEPDLCQFSRTLKVLVWGPERVA